MTLIRKNILEYNIRWYDTQPSDTQYNDNPLLTATEFWKQLKMLSAIIQSVVILNVIKGSFI